MQPKTMGRNAALWLVSLESGNHPPKNPHLKKDKGSLWGPFSVHASCIPSPERWGPLFTFFCKDTDLQRGYRGYAKVVPSGWQDLYFLYRDHAVKRACLFKSVFGIKMWLDEKKTFHLIPGRASTPAQYTHYQSLPGTPSLQTLDHPSSHPSYRVWEKGWPGSRRTLLRYT